MSVKLIFLAMVNLAIITSPVRASQQAGYVDGVVSAPGTTASVFFVNGTRTTKPSCATEEAWAIPYPATDGSKALFAQILSAFLAGKMIVVVGTGACSVFPNREDVSYANIQG